MSSASDAVRIADPSAVEMATTATAAAASGSGSATSGVLSWFLHTMGLLLLAATGFLFLKLQERRKARSYLHQHHARAQIRRVSGGSGGEAGATAWGQPAGEVASHSQATDATAASHGMTDPLYGTTPAHDAALPSSSAVPTMQTQSGMRLPSLRCRSPPLNSRSRRPSPLQHFPAPLGLRLPAPPATSVCSRRRRPEGCRRRQHPRRGG